MQGVTADIECDGTVPDGLVWILPQLELGAKPAHHWLLELTHGLQHRMEEVCSGQLLVLIQKVVVPGQSQQRLRLLYNRRVFHQNNSPTQQQCLMQAATQVLRKAGLHGFSRKGAKQKK